MPIKNVYHSLSKPENELTRNSIFPKVNILLMLYLL